MASSRSGKSLGISKKTRQYDLPLNKGAGGYFLRILICLMTFLAILALAASFALGAMTERWTSGLENKASIEIPAEDENGAALPKEKLESLTNDIHRYLISNPAIETAHIMTQDEISDLVGPWLGENIEFNSIPLPGIISVSFKDNVDLDRDALATRMQAIAPQARLDTHENWLQNVLRFTGALNFAALLVTVVIGITTIVAVGGAVQSRMAIYKEELELLHLMGASDNYISKQLQRYVFIISIQGALLGALMGAITLTIIGWLAGRMDISLIPDFSLSLLQMVGLFALAPLIAIMAVITARHTVLRALALMP